MNISMQYFLVVAEELSISRAAERLYVSQQCVSSHIKKLEQQYCVELFVRKPAFCLTEEGKALQRSLLRQKVGKLSCEGDERDQGTAYEPRSGGNS